MTSRPPQSRLGVAVAVATLIPLVLMAHSLATARVESEAARAAVTEFLAAFKQMLAPTGEAPLGGRPATSAETAAMAALAQKLAGHLRAGRLQRVFDLTHPDTRGTWTRAAWQHQRSAAPQRDPSDVPGLQYWILRYAASAQVSEVELEGAQGTALVSMEMCLPGELALRRLENRGWALDLQRQMAADAGENLIQQLEVSSGASRWRGPVGFFFMSEAGPLGLGHLEKLALPLKNPRLEVTGAVVDGNVGTLRFTVSGTLRMAVPIVQRRGWHVSIREAPVILQPEETIPRARMSASSKAEQASCLSNLKQLGVAFLMYASDYDEHFPIARSWSDATYPYTHNWAIYHCPSDKEEHSYAMNWRLSRQSLAAVKRPAQTYLLYESDLGVKNAFDAPQAPGASLATPPRHDGGNNFAYVDGHAMWVDSRRIDRQGWKLQ